MRDARSDLASLQLGCLADLLGHDPAQLGVEPRGRRRELVDRVLLRATSTVIATIWVLTVRRLALISAERAFVLPILRRQARLAGAQAPDRRLLLRDELLELAAAGRRRRPARRRAAVGGVDGREQPAERREGRGGAGRRACRSGACGGWSDQPDRRSVVARRIEQRLHRAGVASRAGARGWFVRR